MQREKGRRRWGVEKEGGGREGKGGVGGDEKGRDWSC